MKWRIIFLFAININCGTLNNDCMNAIFYSVLNSRRDVIIIRQFGLPQGEPIFGGRSKIGGTWQEAIPVGRDGEKR